MDSPVFQHDCYRCRFMGRVVGRRQYDSYWCENAIGGSAILRYGDEGEEYDSYPATVLGNPAYTGGGSETFAAARRVFQRARP